jgi:hypothetical protein
MEKISKLQIVDQKYWSHLTQEKHLGWLGMQDPIYLSKVMNKVYEINYGSDNLVSFIESIPSMEIEDEGSFRWMLMGNEERNIPLIKASLSEAGTVVNDTDKPGLGRSRFYLYFPENYFSATSVIVGENPNSYSLRIVDDPVETADGHRVKVELVTGDDTLFVPAEDLKRGTRWSEEYGLVERELSKRGNSVHHAGPMMMENTTSVIRKNYEVPGNMITKGKNKPLAFAFVDENGKTQTRWLDKLGWDFQKQMRWDKSRLWMYGRSNKMSDGSYGNKGESGNTIYSGFGLYEQMEGGHLLYYNNFNLDMLTDFAMDITVGKFREDSRKFVMSTGERGAYEFHKSASNKASGYSWLQSGHNFKMEGGKMKLDEGQIMKYVSVNGIEFNIIIDPMKDDPVRNKILHPRGGLASSYIYDIFDFGTTNGEHNIQRVTVKDNEEFFRYIPGMRDPFSPYNKQTAPSMAATSIDGYAVYKQYIGGIVLRNPLKTARIIPSMLRY